jgi:hypothetical protein
MEALMPRFVAIRLLVAAACGGDDPCAIDTCVEVDGGARPDGGGSADGGNNASARRTFVTSGSWDGSLGFHDGGATGLQGADNLCNAAASGAQLGGT